MYQITFFNVGVVKHWNRLPREVVESLSPEILQTQMDTCLSNLLQLTFMTITFFIGRVISKN